MSDPHCWVQTTGFGKDAAPRPFIPTPPRSVLWEHRLTVPPDGAEAVLKEEGGGGLRCFAWVVTVNRDTTGNESLCLQELILESSVKSALNSDFSPRLALITIRSEWPDSSSAGPGGPTQGVSAMSHDTQLSAHWTELNTTTFLRAPLV